jgi:hypothetical protein
MYILLVKGDGASTGKAKAKSVPKLLTPGGRWDDTDHGSGGCGGIYTFAVASSLFTCSGVCPVHN